MQLEQWAKRHDISQDALDELRASFGCIPIHIPQLEGHGENYVQSKVRLEAPGKGVTLWRNNSGVLPNPETGRPVRFGLGNDTKQLNEKLKSADLIGWRRLIITPDMVGTTIGQFVSRECKEPGWKYTGKGRELAQLKWLKAVVAAGGDAQFCSGEGTL